MASLDLDVATLEERLAAFRRVPSNEPGRRAAVAIGLSRSPRGHWQFALTIRSSALRSHAGQYALPGGHVDGEETSVETAVREMEEELGLPPSLWRRSFLLDDYVTKSGRVITPVVLLSDEPVATLTPDPGEVAEAFLIPLTELREEDPAVRLEDTPNPVLGLHVDRHLIFAPTAAILLQFRDLARYGRTTRVAAIREPQFATR